MGEVGLGQVLPLMASGEVRKPDSPADVQEAARQFESLLLGQILRSVREADGGWLGGGDAAGDCATGFAEEQLANALSQAGGLGLARLIAAGLAPGH